MKRLTVYQPTEFSSDTWTERGERVYKVLRITFKPQFGPPIVRVIACDKQVGITEEWIEDTLVGAFEALEKDYPADKFELDVHKPNDVTIRYSGMKGMVN